MENNAVFELISKKFPTKQDVMTEIINLHAILNLPKGTEHFLSDLHGESETFLHLLRNASGVIRTKIDLAFGDTMTESEKNRLASLIYYPEYVLPIITKGGGTEAIYTDIFHKLIEILKLVSAKYTRSKVKKALPPDYRYIIDELINMPDYSIDKSAYYSSIISGIVEVGNADKFIREMCLLIQKLAIDHLHIVGDIFDRGNGADIILDSLMDYHSVDIEWGNHDILWMGAHFGNPASVCNVIRINCIYRNLQVIENYGINLRPLMAFALENYASDSCDMFSISDVYGCESDFEKNELLAKMAKAITVIQLKLENRLIANHKEFEMDDRILYPSSDLTEKEKLLIAHLTSEFVNNERLGKHISFLLSKGSMYKVFNGNLLMHGCVPTDDDKEFTKVSVGGTLYSGKALYDRLDALVRDAARGDKYSTDYMWYLWCGKKSPLYGRNKMCVYTKYFKGFSEDELKDNYYKFVKDEDFCLKVLHEFGANKEYSVIVNGHIPVRASMGEHAESGNCRRIAIDGGLSRAYYSKTGIGGYTLINNSQGLFLVSHAPFFSSEEAINNASDLKSKRHTLMLYKKRILVKETDVGTKIAGQIEVLKDMLENYYK